jgi:SMODS and SLOG-associating 2TM effector domain 3/SMODS and SLOG-associating 2TM effector domain 1
VTRLDTLVDFGAPDLPALYRAADEHSNDVQAGVLKALKVSLIGVVVAAGFGAVSLHSGSVEWAGVISSLAFGLSAVCTAWLLWGKPEKEWYDARAVAESVKTLAWQYAVAGGEFDPKGEESATRERFLGRLEDMLDGAEDLRLPAPREAALPPRLEQLRSGNFELRRSIYVKRRLAEQRQWYADKTRWNESRRRAWTAVTVGLLGAGLLAGLARGFLGLEPDLLGPLAAAAGSAMAWARSKDYAELAAAYSVTAHELGIAETEAEAVGAEDDWPPFVARAERAISREHTLWKARRGAPRMGP